jgi:Rieske Fe-S protein
MNDNSINALINNYCNRREFVKDSLTGIGTVAFGSFIMINQSSCSSNPTAPNNSDVTITLDLSLSENSALLTVGGALALAANELDSSGMLLYRQSESTVKVYSRNCTHAGCPIGAFSSSGISSCQCHGSRFDTNGNVVTGPAAIPLNQYSAAISEDIVTITL